ncbi:MAG: diphosphomevalonate decarboxylase [Proteobacteria bacterium]|nr:diphosphomevalonate decarboxylase [Pseudomonadota bacterium]
MARTSRARALANLALVKYFGKRDISLNLPAAGSLSLTLEPLATTTEVSFIKELINDEVLLENKPVFDRPLKRVSSFLDIVRNMAGTKARARVTTSNSFPTAAGLASSASGFAALALAATRALDMDLDSDALSALARQGSGSASRSIPGGIAVWHAGERPDGSDSFARSIAEPGDWDLRVVVGVASSRQKAIGSTDAMELTRKTSPYYEQWIACANADLGDGINAVKNRDFTSLGEITERSALSMHAAALAARPGIIFWKSATIEALHMVRRLRSQGLEAYFTCDAGPQPKILCTADNEETVAAALEDLPGITRIIRCHIGSGAALV